MRHPLNRDLTQRGARLVRRAPTAASDELYALPNTTPPKPGLVRVAGETGYAIEGEVWERPIAAFGSLLTGIPPPLSVSTLELGDGTTVQGFLCEVAATRGADDISRFGGWRAFLDARATAGPMQRARLMRSRTVSARRCTSIRRSSDDQAFRSDCRFHRARHALQPA